jgi:sulfonate transport system permease protein
MSAIGFLTRNCQRLLNIHNYRIIKIRLLTFIREKGKRTNKEMYKLISKQNIDRLIPWGVPIGLIMIWQSLSQLGLISTRILPAPTAVIEAAIRLASTGELLHHISTSAYRALMGFVIGGAIGFILGLSNGAFTFNVKRRLALYPSG